MRKTFPRELFVAHDKDGDNEWFLCDEDMTGLVTMGVTKRVAVYRLVEVRAVTGTVEFKKSKNAV